jgi:hypothetical protein
MVGGHDIQIGESRAYVERASIEAPDEQPHSLG